MSTRTRISKKQRNKSRKTELDLISNLPDCVISHILSRLPTKDAVRTSVLSKDWELKWTLKYNIELDDKTTYIHDAYGAYVGKLPKSEAAFADFVDRTLLLSQNLHSFRLSCQEEYDLIRMETWISTALSRNVHNLDIYYRHGGLVLPFDLLNYSSLRKLDLSIVPCTLKLPAPIRFPHLTSLFLTGVEFVNELCNSDVVKLNLPVLETFILINYKWLNVKFVEIDAPKMTTFAFMTAHDAGVSDFAFKITGGSRLKLETYGGLPETVILSGGSEVVHADIKGCCVEEDLYRVKNGGVQIRKLMNGLLSLKELYIFGRVAKALAVSKPRLSLPKYYKMERLVLRYVSNTEVLLELLHAAPFLKFIHLHVISKCKDYDYDAVEHVPSCIIYHLEEVKFGGSTRMMKFVKFILKSALQLKTLHVSCKDFAEKLLKYPRASTCLSITWEMMIPLSQQMK